ncbi:peptidase C15, pyroglutamyl peptidase I-like protein [Lindgomyces ingoldianus]|uniref:Peptidase C15, pyroglutamyl peptidase I-like protein n=1 Tax=Lindgomyces ingoldianus TaxID=673940 RepID=A0ACB6R7R9_9PLEO|nr:peptidase C15, pyroglutamyl peptidase I-like protein [Lindgomyces ingoldianus]KAF2475304.1 peptidase C15, pyroglutamyl peptidase I-like protein [Lindgomyces ingoldianus]
MAAATSDQPIKVLITGFGPFQALHPYQTNPSWILASLLSPTLSSSFPNIPIRLLIPSTPMPAAYHKILVSAPQLIAQNDPDIVIHIGLAGDRDYFAVELGAQKEGYHDVPDIDRRVFTRVENKKGFGKEVGELRSGVDLESVVRVWGQRLKGLDMPAKEQGKSTGAGEGGNVDVRLSDDVGNFVCGFIYYVSLLEMQKKKGTRDVVFLHVPMLESKEEIGVGVRVTEELIRAVVEVWWEGRR